MVVNEILSNSKIRYINAGLCFTGLFPLENDNYMAIPQLSDCCTTGVWALTKTVNCGWRFLFYLHMEWLITERGFVTIFRHEKRTLPEGYLCSSQK